MMPADGWAGRLDLLWREDDGAHASGTSRQDRLGLAWRRLFGGCFPVDDSAWIARVDRGDSEVMLDGFGRAYVAGYPGSECLGVLSGSRASVLPRLIISGGQTGADRGAMDAALELGVSIGGCAPRGWRAEDGAIPERYRADMRQHDRAAYAPRTVDNILDSDGTLIVSISDRLSGGSALTRVEARRLGRPCLHVAGELAESGAGAAAVLAWIREHRIGSLNVAGPRESKDPGIREVTRGLILGVLRGALADLGPPPVPAPAPADPHLPQGAGQPVGRRGSLRRVWRVPRRGHESEVVIYGNYQGFS